MREGWVEKCIDECTEIEFGTRVVQKRDGGNTYPVYGGGGETFKMNTFNREDCLIVSRFAMSKCCVRFVSGKFFLNDSGLSVKSGKGLEQCYLNHCLFYHNDEIYNLGKGAAQRNLDVKSFKKLIITIPPISTQLSIASELDKIIEMISKYDEQLKELDKLSQSIFYEMFGDPVENEKGWEVKIISDVSTYFNGVAHEQDIDDDGEFTLINSKFISTNGKVQKRTNKQRFPLLKNDLTMVLSDVPNGKALAKCYLVNEDNKYSLNQRICCFRGYEGAPLFFKYVVNRHQYFLSFNDGKGQTNLRKGDVEKMPIILPPLPLQQSFARKIEAIEAMKTKVKEAKKEAETLLAARMQYWFE